MCPTYRTILVIPIIQIPTTLIFHFPEDSLAEVIDRDEHEGGLHLNLQRPLRTVRATSSVRRSERLFRCDLREWWQSSHSFPLLEQAMNLGPRKGQRQPTIDLREYVDGLYSYALVLSRNRTEAEDLVQETCLRALRAMERLRPDSNAKSWLFTILRNIWFNHLRQWRTAPEIVELDLDGNGPNKAVDTAKDPLATYVSNVEQERVRTAIQQLSAEFREIIILREYRRTLLSRDCQRSRMPSGDGDVTPGKSTLQAPGLAFHHIVGAAIGKEPHEWRRKTGT